MSLCRREIRLGPVRIGGDAPISVQSMTKVPTTCFDELLAEVRRLEAEGCQIIRIAVPDKEQSIENLTHILDSATVPIVADVHFDYEIALRAIERGAHGIRINPGNIRSSSKLHQIADAARTYGTVIRVGINSGSLEPDIRKRDGGVTPRGLTDSALRHCREIESRNHPQIKVSIKASDLVTTINANRLFASESNIPLHIGITEAGPPSTGTIKSAIGIGHLLLQNIGDTIRVSLSGDPVEEVRVGSKILACLGLLPGTPDIVSCPTCGRKNLDVTSLAESVENEVQRLIGKGYRFSISKIAIMGCAVNGPGEARDADLGVAGTQNDLVLFKNGQIVQHLSGEDIETAILEEIRLHTIHS